MAFDEGLAERVAELLSDVSGVDTKKMFGSLAYLVHGNMAVGVIDSDLLVRLGADDREEALSEPGVRPADMAGRPMRGWVLVSPEATSDDPELAAWVDRGVAHASSLPPK